MDIAWLCMLSRKAFALLPESGHDWTDRFPAIVKAAKKLDGATAILDGEAVVLDEQGRSDFGLLQQSLGDRGGKRISTEAIFMAFDLLYFDGHDPRPLEFTARRHLLDGLIKSRDDVIRLPFVSHVLERALWRKGYGQCKGRAQKSAARRHGWMTIARCAVRGL